MKQFEHINRQYVPTVDLGTLQQTYNTLEQGHKEAVKAASDLEIQIANLPMNEQEDDFKQQLINEIKTTVANNTIYGNAYNALDDIIAKSGDIGSDARIIGRLRNNAEKEKFDAKVDSMQMEEGMKQMFKELNPYTYKDGEIDRKTGKVTIGEKWKANKTPVNQIPEAEIQKYALAIAAKEKGSINSVTFLDANGKPTTDVSKSVDGAIYQQINGDYERLSIPSVEKAYREAIKAIPGAEESLKQDFEYARYKKAKQHSKDKAVVIPGLTDENGNEYDFNGWLKNKIHGFADTVDYNHVSTKVNFGTALENYLTRKNATNGKSSGSSGSNENSYIDRFSLHNVGTRKIEGSNYANMISIKDSAGKAALDIVRTKGYNNFKTFDQFVNYYMKKHKSPGPVSAAQQFIKFFGNDLSTYEKTALINAATSYGDANMQIKNINRQHPKDADLLKFSSNIAEDRYTNDNTYGATIINKINEIFNGKSKVSMSVGNYVLEHVASQYGFKNINDLKTLGIQLNKINDDYYDIVIPKEASNRLPRLSYEVLLADSQVAGDFASGFLKLFGVTSKENINIKSFDNGRVITREPYIMRANTLRELSKLYSKGMDKSKNAEKNIGITSGEESILGYGYGSLGAMVAEEKGRTDGWKPSDIKSEMEMADRRLDKAFANNSFDPGTIEYIDDNYHISKDKNKNRDTSILLQKMYASSDWRKHVSREVLQPNEVHLGQPTKYHISFTIPKGAVDDNNEHYKEGDFVNIIVGNTIQEGVSFNPSYNPNTLATNVLNIADHSNGNVHTIGYDDDLGDTSFRKEANGSYRTTFLGNTKPLNRESAKFLATNIYTIKQLKNQVLSGLFSDANGANRLNSEINTLSSNISAITNKSQDDISLMVLNYILNGKE